MISPNSRKLLSDALTPPPAMHFDVGVVTTFSLDPITLLSVPLRLAWHGLGDDRAQLADPVLLVEALHRVADRLTVFSQRGQLFPPEHVHPLSGLLDVMIHEATTPHGGAFHAKLWLLRFTTNDGEPPLLRLLIPSRNLTADSSWDLCLQLEGRPERTRFGPNKPLADFLAALPRCTRRPLTEQRASNLKMLRDEAWHCRWELPGNFTDIQFHVLGLGRRPAPWQPVHSNELGVVSPFLGARTLEMLRGSTERPIFLISRAEEMDKLPDALNDFEALRTLNPQAEGEDENPGNRLRGLHAKALVLKCSWDTHLILGSANATNAALLAGINVEILAELVGRCSRVGRPELWLSDDKGLGEMLVPYMPQDTTNSETPTPEALRLDEVQKGLIALDMELHCEREEAAWRLTLHSRTVFELGDVRLDARPFTVVPERTKPLPVLDPDQPVPLGVFAAAEVTSLVAFHLQLDGEQRSFARNLHLRGGPKDRDLAVLGLVLHNREAFVRYLLLLLTGDAQLPDLPAGRTAAGKLRADDGRGDGAEDVPLFELLARTWARTPERLNEVATLLRRLQGATDDRGEPVVPPEFSAIWRVFETALAKEATQHGER